MNKNNDKRKIGLIMILTLMVGAIVFIVLNGGLIPKDNTVKTEGGNSEETAYTVLSEEAILDTDLSKWYEENKSKVGVFTNTTDDKTYVLVSLGETGLNHSLALLDTKIDEGILTVTYEDIVSIPKESDNGTKEVNMVIELNGKYKEVVGDLYVSDIKDYGLQEEVVVFKNWINGNSFNGRLLTEDTSDLKTYKLTKDLSVSVEELKLYPEQIIRIRYEDKDNLNLKTLVEMIEPLDGNENNDFSVLKIFFNEIVENEKLIVGVNYLEEKVELKTNDNVINFLKKNKPNKDDLIELSVYENSIVVDAKAIKDNDEVINKNDTNVIEGKFVSKREDFITLEINGEDIEFKLFSEAFDLVSNKDIKVGEIIRGNVFKSKTNKSETILFIR